MTTVTEQLSAHTTPYHEYLHLVRMREGWTIANVLWRST